MNTTPKSRSEILNPKYRLDIDGLRAIAVLFVVGFHAFPGRIHGGFVGVDIFFVISGYLISTILFQSIDKGQFSYRQFYIRRIRRIFPTLILVLFSCIFLGWFILLAEDYVLLSKHLVGAVAFISNYLLWTESGYFDTAANSKVLLHLWSLAIEEQFYIVWPLALVIIYGRGWKLLSVTLASLVLSFIANIAILDENTTTAFFSPFSRFWELMIGSVLAYLSLNQPHAISKYKNIQSFLGLFLLACAVTLIDETSHFPGWWALLPTLGSALIISAGSSAWLNRTFLSNKLLVWFGLISYPLYLWHWPILSFARINASFEPPGFVRLLLVFVAIFMSWLTLKLIEQPVRQRGFVTTLSLIICLILVGVCGGIIISNDGFERRAANVDESKLFIHSYEKLKKNELFELYLEKCDFYDWRTKRSRNAISHDCIESNIDQKTLLLWGDSHAQALSYGIRENLPKEMKFTQIATSGCKPKLHFDPSNGVGGNSCTNSNNFAVDFIRKNKPTLVFAAQQSNHELTDWNEISEFVRENGGKFILVGPVPQWRPSLPIVVAKKYMNKGEYIEFGLDESILRTNETLTSKYRSASFQYISLIDKLCGPQGCRARMHSHVEMNLIVMDYGHLTQVGSDFVAKTILYKYFQVEQR